MKHCTEYDRQAGVSDVADEQDPERGECGELKMPKTFACEGMNASSISRWRIVKE
jgi:hypothetical protein